MIGKIKNILRKKSFLEIFQLFDYRLGFGLWERIIFSNWLNPCYTIYLNFRSFRFMQAVYMPVLVYGHPRIYGLSGRMNVIGKITFGMIKFNQTKPGAPSNMDIQSEIFNNGLIIFRGKGMVGTGTKIHVGFNATLDIGENFKITDMCNIGCFSQISIGAQTWIVHRCQILDANYHYVANFEKGIVPKWANPIKLGKGVWVCNNSTVMGGTILPDFTIVASNSLVGKDFSSIPSSSMIGGVPAKLIGVGYRKIEDSRIENRIATYYQKNPEGLYQIPENDTMDKYSYVDKFK